MEVTLKLTKEEFDALQMLLLFSTSNSRLADMNLTSVHAQIGLKTVHQIREQMHVAR